MAKRLSVIFGLIALVFGFIDLVLYLKPNPAPVNVKVTFPTPPPILTNVPDKKVSIMITGDIMLGRSVMTTSLSKGNPNYPFEMVADKLRGASLVLGNLENPIVSDCPSSNSGLKFCTDPKMVSGLKFAGIDMLSIANNHIRNYGESGVQQTQSYLSSEGVDYVGVGDLIVKNLEGTKFGFLGFDFVEKGPDNTDFELIKNSKDKVDVLIVMVHWGLEYKSEPSPSQRVIAKLLVNSGADVVAGSHPHWVQTIEYINEKPVFYSLGNFIFDQPWSEETKKGLVVQLNYQKGKLLNVDKFPIYMESLAQPQWVR